MTPKHRANVPPDNTPPGHACRICKGTGYRKSGGPRGMLQQCDHPGRHVEPEPPKRHSGVTQ